MFLIPLINIQKLQTNFRKLVQSKSKSTSDNSTILSKLSSDKCAICYYEKYLNAGSMDLGQGGNDQLNAKFLGDEDCTLQLAYQSNCGHLFCYACISTNLKQDSDYCCIVCDERVTNIERYNEIKE
jgi:peroxin-2